MQSVHIDQITRAISAGAEEMFRRQRPDGAFTDSPPGSVLGTSGSIAALHAADPTGSAALIEAGAEWLRRQQRPDGGWGGVAGADTELVPTIIATATLHHVAPQRSEEAVAAGRRRLAELGGVAVIDDLAVTAMCKQFLALAGLPEAGQLRRLPLELVLFDKVRRERMSFRTAPFIGMALLQTRTLPPPGPLRRATRRLALPTALRLLETIHRHEGQTGVLSEDPWPAALVSLGLTHAGEAPHLVTAITGFLREAVRPDGSWDAVANLDLTRSGFAATGLIAAGYGDDPRLATTRELFHRNQQAEPFTVLGVPAGGWSYSGPRGWPVTLESAEILSALARLPGHDGDPVLRTGLDWLVDRQDQRGSWSLWVRDTKLPNDGPCPGITSQGIIALRDAGHAPDSPPVVSAAQWLLTQQRPDGSFHNLWYRDFTTGTAIVLDALVHAGLGADPVAVRAKEWLLRAQLANGSWGSGGATDDGSVEETAWTLPALLAAGVPAGDEAIRRGIGWLLAAQEPDGIWRPSRICAYIRNYMYYPNGAIAQSLALRALGTYRAAVGAAAR
ncbi:prenyltransferase/squalene oxidase repeat-containing protein [Micromonospora sp. NBC_01796]|uniref:prenyltransferase/squalene oxidase repeat-containing protein n=1 Tax=Micromonospora sp. NBC_01796 TaxID=2975987 RepID=UPI002DD9E399|nr:prenyltransferase/squalene oxidase repeat-containing protein [Micromonospora sp. NBC_01796]WSA85476.1 prenyltransferase [Micromonospora sp. NBC_01796]